MQSSEVKIWKNWKQCVRLIHGENAKFWGEDIKKIESSLLNMCMVKMQTSEVKIWKKNSKQRVELIHGENAKFWVEDIKKNESSLLSMCMVKMQTSEVKILKKLKTVCQTYPRWKCKLLRVCMSKYFLMARECKFNQHEVLATSTQAIGLATTRIDESLYRVKWH